jgi:chemotaxis protein CheC
MMADIQSKSNRQNDDDLISVSHPLGELEMDALTEVVNIGVSRAANSLRELVGEQVYLTVPALAIMTRAEVAAVIAIRSGNLLVAVRQGFEGEFTGAALLIFPETNSLELIRAVTRGDLPLEDIIELEQEALAEIGNIILNSCMGTIANLLKRSLKMSLPEIIRGNGADLFESPMHGITDGVLFIRIKFSLKGHEVSGYVAIVMDFLSLEALQALISDFIGRVAQ